MACLKIGAMKQSPSCSIHWTSHSQASQPSHIYGSSWPTFFFIYYRVFTLILPFYSLLHKLYNYFCHRSFFSLYTHFMLLPSYIFYLELYNRIFISTTGHRLDLAPSIPGKKVVFMAEEVDLDLIWQTRPGISFSDVGNSFIFTQEPFNLTMTTHSGNYRRCNTSKILFSHRK